MGHDMNILDFQNVVKNAFSFVSGMPLLRDIGFEGNTITIKNAEGNREAFVAFDGSSNAPKLQYKENEFSLIGKDGAIKALKSVPFTYTTIDSNSGIPETLVDMYISTTLHNETVSIDLTSSKPKAGDRIIIKHMGNGITNVLGAIDDKDSIELTINGISVTLIYTDQWYLV